MITEPPPVIALGALQCIEIFCATHMFVEIGMELSVAVANKRGKQQMKDPWFLLALLVLVCNWLSILRPSISNTFVLLKEGAIEAPAPPPALQPSEGGGAVSAAAATLLNNAKLGKSSIGSGMILNKVISVGRVFRIVRPIRTLRMIRNVDVIVTVLAESVGASF